MQAPERRFSMLIIGVEQFVGKELELGDKLKKVVA